MPELPEVETVRRGLQPVLEHKSMKRLEQRRPNLRFPFPENFAARVEGQTITSLGRRAKYLLADLSSGDVLVMHLGMSGSFRIEAPEGMDMPGTFHHDRSKLSAHDHVVFHMEDGTTITYNDPRRFGFMLLIPRAEIADHALFQKMGIEPLGNALTPDYLAARFKGRTTSLKAALLDQRNVVGLGNIYVAEALWRAGLSPKRSAGSLVTKTERPTKHLEPLIGIIRAVLSEAIEAGGSSLRDHAQTDGSLGYFQHRFSVYDREAVNCQRDGCKGVIEKFTQNGRSTYWCPTCQR
ncbi:MAG: bifunctional DNA-formamidopyrimidine glycosylase/DNA-(apurinic or apyrimidinic site) lyase [Hyphomicrobiales bacterium]